MIGDGEIVLADIKVWAAGIKGSDWLCSLDGLEINLVQQLMVEESLQTTRDENIFAIGDCAACTWAGYEGNVPPRAQAAHHQATLLSKSLVDRVKGKTL